jgi:hypothetical protein
MESNLKKNKWLSGAGTLVSCAAIVVAMKVAALSGSGSPTKLSPRAQVALASKVAAANQASDATYALEAGEWRRYLQSARSTPRLHDFVGELIGLEQKLQSGLALFNAGKSDEERARDLFRKHILDERKLATEMQSAVDVYQRMLFEQDRQVFEMAGVSREEWARMIQTSKPDGSAWTQAVQPVIARAVSEARQDVARFGANWLASDWTAKGVKKAARKTGLDRTEEGGFADWISGAAVDVITGVVLEQATDPTEKIIANLSQDMTRVEYALLDSEQGLFTVMQRMKSAHESARHSLLTTSPGR